MIMEKNAVTGFSDSNAILLVVGVHCTHMCSRTRYSYIYILNLSPAVVVLTVKTTVLMIVRAQIVLVIVTVIRFI